MTRLTLIAALAVLSACTNTATGHSVLTSENNAFPIPAPVVRHPMHRPPDWEFDQPMPDFPAIHEVTK